MERTRAVSGDGYSPFLYAFTTEGAGLKEESSAKLCLLCGETFILR